MSLERWEIDRWVREVECKNPSEKLVLWTLRSYAGLDRAGPGTGWCCFVGQKRLAEECVMSERSVRSHLAAMEERGLITREHRYPAERKGKRSSDWTFLAADLAGSAESDHYRQPSVALPATERASLPAASCRVTVSKQEQQEEQGRTPSGDDDTPDELVDAKALCDLLAGRIEAYSGKRPKIRKRWITEMDLLLRRGPTDWATPERISRGEVVSMINRIFDYPDPRSGSTFSWAKNIQSAPTLRDKWEKLRTHEFTPDYQTYDDDTAWMASSATREELGLPLVERS